VCSSDLKDRAGGC